MPLSAALSGWKDLAHAIPRGAILRIADLINAAVTYVMGAPIKLGPIRPRPRGVVMTWASDR